MEFLYFTNMYIPLHSPHKTASILGQTVLLRHYTLGHTLCPHLWDASLINVTQLINKLNT